MSPEQEASLINFKVQLAEVVNVITLLKDEQEELLLFFYLNGGYSKEAILKVMEEHENILHLSLKEDGLSLNLQRLAIEQRIFKKDYDIASAEVFSGVSIGPTYLYENMGDFRGSLFGVALSMPIPLWNLNGAQKARTNAIYEGSKKAYQLNVEKERVEGDFLFNRINLLKDGLSKMLSDDEIYRAHKRMEALYSQGLVTSSVFLDSHRVLRDVIASKLELEERILLLMIQSYRLKGKLTEVHL